MFEAHERRGYAKGYRAGRGKRIKDITMRQKAIKDAAFRDRAFLAMLPVVFAPGFAWGRTIDGKFHKYSTPSELIDFAWEEAQRSLARRPR
jgi:hypothetical protein